jgi:hypothetical protein
MADVIDITNTRKPDAFDNALAVSRRGDKIIYYRGEAAVGAHKKPALKASDAGRVSLVQKRLGPGMFEYTAQVLKGGA